LLWTTLCVAQQPGTQESPAPESLKGVQLKGKAPVNPNTLRVVLPRAQEATLSNGLRVALLEDHKLPTFSLQLAADRRRSRRSRESARPGDGHCFAAARRARHNARVARSQSSSRRWAALLGCRLAVVGRDVIGIGGLERERGQDPRDRRRRRAQSRVPEAELAKYKSRFVSQLQQQRAQPGFRRAGRIHARRVRHASWQLRRAAGDVLRDLTRADLASYHKAHYKPNNGIVLAYGDFKLGDLVQKLERAFGDWPKGECAPISLPELKPPAKARVLLVDRPGSVQTSLWLGGLGIERRSDDYFAVLVMNHILGGGPASRLFINLREDKGYTYGVQSFFNGSRFPGVILATTDVRTQVTEGALHELTAEVRRIGNEPVPEDELKKAKRALVGGFALSLDSPQTLLSNLATQKIYNLPADYWDTYPQRVEAITAADVQRVAKKYYDANRLQLIAVGDAASVKKVLEQYGTVETPPPAAAGAAQ
jgi:predicted Zn-dependent peptidase